MAGIFERRQFLPKNRELGFDKSVSSIPARPDEFLSETEFPLSLDLKSDSNLNDLFKRNRRRLRKSSFL